MSEIEKKAIAIKVYYKCDECLKGYLSFTGRTRKGIDKMYFYHKCNECKKVFELIKQYPAIKFIDEDIEIKGLNN